MTRSPRVLLQLLLLPAILAAALPAAAAPASPAQAATGPVFGESIDVRVVNVEVVVTDRDGNRVAGLGPQDFRLIVDGTVVPIDYFTEVRGGDAVRPAASASAVRGLPALAPGEPVGTNYLVFVDDYFPIKRDRDVVLAALAADLPNLGPADRMAIVAFDGKQVSMISSWSDSRPQLEQALRGAEQRPAYGLQWIALQNSFAHSFDRRFRRNPVRLASALDIDAEDRAYANEVQEHVGREIAAAVATLRGFADPPGRKVMLVLSGGWPFSPLQYVAKDYARELAAYGTYEGSDLYAPLTDTANLLGYTLYPVDVPGLATGFGADVQRDVALDPDRFSLTAPFSPFERERLVQDSLYYLADATGGEALINSRRLTALERTADDTRSYYWIGFTPTRKEDDARHRIRVEPVIHGLTARARSGFLDMSSGAENDMAVESALLFGDAATVDRLQATAGTPEPAGRKTIELPLRLTLPADGFSTLLEGGEQVARLELRVAAHDVHNRTSDVPTAPIELRFTTAPPAGSTVSYDTRVRLRDDDQVLVISIHDPLSGQNLMTRLTVNP